MAAKQLLKYPFVRVTLTLLVSLLLRFIYLSSRVQRVIPHVAEPYMAGAKQAVFCFWHGNMIMQPFQTPKGRKMAVLISRHRDGEVISSVMRWLGIGTVHGSTGKRGAGAMRELFATCDAGSNIAITPDGPRGPVYQAQHGAALLARKTGLPLIPIAFAASRGKRFSSWDHFFLPYPFTRLCYVVGEPIFAADTDTDDAISTTLRERMMACMEHAQREMAA